MTKESENQKEKFAMKVIKKDKLRVNITSQKESTSTLCVNELKALKNLHHPNIVQIKEVINDTKEKNVYLIM